MAEPVIRFDSPTVFDTWASFDGVLKVPQAVLAQARPLTVVAQARPFTVLAEQQ